MTKPPYSSFDAQQLCSGFQHLRGQPFDTASVNGPIIEYVAIAPYDEVEKSKFIIYFHLFSELQHLSLEEQKCIEYDVLVIARSMEDHNDILHQDLYSWLIQNNMPAERNIIAETLKAAIKNINSEQYRMN